MYIKEPHWRNLNAFKGESLSPITLSWLLDMGSLTQRLRNHTTKFSVELLSQRWALPYHSERQHLQLRPRQWAIIREVKLICDEVPWVFGRSIIPLCTLTGYERGLFHLGTKPLGQLLFDDPTMIRSNFQLAEITSNHDVYDRIVCPKVGMMPSDFANITKPSLWGRRSVFYLAAKPLIVSEIFTPQFPFYKNCWGELNL